jgi:hypothetical protein
MIALSRRPGGGGLRHLPMERRREAARVPENSQPA